ncbi:hypothetical protein ACFL6I_18100 [candidate division KSB1 bacterium]
MIDEETIRLFNDRINIDFAERNKILKDGIQEIKEDENEKRMLHSGRTYSRIAELCADEIKVRNHIAWQTLFRILTTSGIVFSEQLASEIQSNMSTCLKANFTEIKEIFCMNVTSASKDIISHLHKMLNDSYDLSFKKVNNEIDLFTIWLKNTELSQNKKIKTHDEKFKIIVMNNYSPVGSIQIGNYTSATVTKIINKDDKKELIKALDIVEKGISAIEKITTFPKDEVVDLVQESKNELSKDNPNKTKLRGLISTIGQSLQSVATLHSAYQALKSAALFLGINLP